MANPKIDPINTARKKHPVPEPLHTTFDANEGKPRIAAASAEVVHRLGGSEIFLEGVFVELEKQLPAQTRLSIGGHPLICFTPLLGYEDSNLKTHHFTKWQIENSSKTRRLKFTLALCFSHRFGGKDTGGNFIDKKAGVQATREIVLER
jgi:hypothetical protein